MIFHVLINHRHSVTFLSNASKFFNPDKHRFIFLDGAPQGYDWSGEMLASASNLIQVNSLNVSSDDCIVLHSLFYSEDLLGQIFSLKRYSGVKIVWSSWGFDFISTMRRRGAEIFGNVDCIIVNRSAFQNDSFPRDTVVDNDTKFYLDPSKYHSSAIDKGSILIGNSGDPSNNHVEILDKIDTTYKIIIPLNYNCPKNYRAELDRWISGKPNVLAIDNMLNSNAYIRLLDTVKLSIYAHNRQQGIHTARTVYQLGGNVCLKKIIPDSNGNAMLNPGYVALFETGCPDLIDFDQIDRVTDDFLQSLGSPRHSMLYTSAWQKFYFEAFENRWS